MYSLNVNSGSDHQVHWWELTTAYDVARRSELPGVLDSHNLVERWRSVDPATSLPYFATPPKKD
jgi:hypothetical protein